MAPVMIDPLVFSSQSSKSSADSRQTLSAWMRKGGMLNRTLTRDSRLYLTLDFKTQILCVHTSTPVPFEDIQEVEPLLARRSDLMEECSSRSLSKLPSCLPWGHKQNGFTLKVQGCKTMTLLCSSSAEAMKWVAALRQAMSEAGAKDALWALPSPVHKCKLEEVQSSSRRSQIFPAALSLQKEALLPGATRFRSEEQASILAL